MPWGTMDLAPRSSVDEASALAPSQGLLRRANVEREDQQAQTLALSLPSRKRRDLLCALGRYSPTISYAPGPSPVNCTSVAATSFVFNPPVANTIGRALNGVEKLSVSPG
jgi:hypothetical protein